MSGRPNIETPSASEKRVAEAAARINARRARDSMAVRITTKRLVLRAPIRGDVPDLVRLADNPAIARMLSRLPSPYTRADAIGFVEIMALRGDERPYAVTVQDRFIGVAGLSFFPSQPPELGYWLGEPHWGNGYATEAGAAILEAAFATGSMPVIRARALAENSASIHVLEKLGFIRLPGTADGTANFAGREVVAFAKEQPRWM